MKRGVQGFTLLELLIAGGILVVILVVLGQLFAASYRSYAVTEEVSEQRQITQAALELVGYELSLSGFRCVDGSASTRTFPESPFEVSGTAPDQSITVRYFENRYVAGSCDGPITATFSVSDGALVRTVEDETSVIVDGVTGLGIVSWLNRANTAFVDPLRPGDENLAGVVIAVGFDGAADEVFTVGFRNSQCADPSACP